MTQRPVKRTDWAEDFTAKFMSLPMAAEAVFHSVQRSTPHGEKEVCDLLIAHRGRGLLISMKCQQDPTSRNPESLARWCSKALKKSTKQVEGAVRSVHEQDIFCFHPTRGRVDFAVGQIRVEHCLSLIETRELVSLRGEIAHEVRGVPHTVLSVNDFLNIVHMLRSFGDVLDYLQGRHALAIGLPEEVGQEAPLAYMYLLGECSFPGGFTYDEVRRSVRARRFTFDRFFKEHFDRPKAVLLFENVLAALRERNPDYRDGLRADQLENYDVARKDYLTPQEVLSDLRLPARRAIGNALLEINELVSNDDNSECMRYHACHFDRYPDIVFVVVSAKGVPRPELLDRLHVLAFSASAFFEKPRCYLIADRDGCGYEHCYVIPGTPTSGAQRAGIELFGNLKMTPRACKYLPD